MARAASAEVCDLIGAFTCLDDLADKALSIFIRDSLIGIGGKLQTLRGGMSGLPEGLAAKLTPGTIPLRPRGDRTAHRHAHEHHCALSCARRPGGVRRAVRDLHHPLFRAASRLAREFRPCQAARDPRDVLCQFHQGGLCMPAPVLGDRLQHLCGIVGLRWRPAPDLLSDGPRGALTASRPASYASIRHIHAAPLGQMRVAPRPGADPDEPAPCWARIPGGPTRTRWASCRPRRGPSG